MWYAIVATDREDSLSDRMKARPAHLARLQTLCDQGRLLTAGPLPAADTENPGAAGFSGSIIIAEFPSLEEALRWAEEDPYQAAGVYEKIKVSPYKQVF